MELKLLNDNELKIVLSNEDMVSLDITCEEINYDEDTGTRRILWDILDKAKHETGFDAAGNKIYVKVYPDKTGGCMMYVKKIDAKIGAYKQEYTTYEKKYKSKLYTATQKKKRILYVFDDSESLYEVCRQLNRAGYTGKSDIYANNEAFYLYIEENREKRTDILSEFGVLVNNPIFFFYISEHSKNIIKDDAVNIFCNIY